VVAVLVVVLASVVEEERVDGPGILVCILEWLAQ
jgi:hypothetical protein